MEAQLLTEIPVDSAARLPGPPELLPGRPDAIVDLQTDEGAALIGGRPRCPLRGAPGIPKPPPCASYGPLWSGPTPHRTCYSVPPTGGVRLYSAAWEHTTPR